MRSGVGSPPVPGRTAPVAAWWASSGADVLDIVGGTDGGLSAGEARARLGRYGANRIADARPHGVWWELRHQFTEPVVLILLAATGLALVLGDTLDALIILGLVLLSGLLGFWQEHQASVTVARLLERVQVHVTVRRDGRPVPVTSEDVVPGDIVILSAGAVVPCDCRVLRSESLQVDESALTGETFPRHKHPKPVPVDTALAERACALFQGTPVVSGQGEAVAVVTGSGTQLGEATRTLVVTPTRASFEQGSARLGFLLARVTVLLTVAILVLNVGLGRPPLEAVLFSLALAIGVTPQMLPAIVSVSLSSGARRLARAKVIVRRLDAIEDLGSMDLLCTDKTGTLTQGAITLTAALDLDGRPDPRVAEWAALNAALQTGFSNPLDEAVLACHAAPAGWRRLAEVPFDFTRKRLSVLIEGPEGRFLVTKGAFANVVAVCSRAGTVESSRPLDTDREDEQFRVLSAQGLRVLGVAVRPLPGASTASATDETDMTLTGLLAFDDPVKDGLTDAVETLRTRGVRLCMLTGDNRLAAAHVAHVAGLDPDPVVVTGEEIDGVDDEQLAATAATTTAFAELTPLHKERVVEALRARGSVVGYLGDGINDAGPLHLADVGISVDSAVDVAKQAAALVLLDKDLHVVADGVALGRQTFMNTLKYVYTTVSANFGNVASMAAASAFLPFLPMLPRQILLLNFMSDLPSLTIAADRVDPEDVATPRHWDIHAVRNFMVSFGLLSSAFDLATFAVLLRVFDAGAALFHTGWFVGSALTELSVLLVLRTRRMAVRSRPGRALLVSSVTVAVATVLLPYLPGAATVLGLVALPVPVLLTLLVITLTYVLAAELTKRVYYRAAAATPRLVPVRRPAPTPRARRLHRLAHEHGRRAA